MHSGMASNATALQARGGTGLLYLVLPLATREDK
jgi:hypothetical protein